MALIHKFKGDFKTLDTDFEQMEVEPSLGLEELCKKALDKELFKKREKEE